MKTLMLLFFLLVSPAYALSPQAEAFVGTTHTTYFSACITESTAQVVWEAHKENGYRAAQMAFANYKMNGACGTTYATATVARVIDEAVLDFNGQQMKAYFVEMQPEEGKTFYAAAASQVRGS